MSSSGNVFKMLEIDDKTQIESKTGVSSTKNFDELQRKKYQDVLDDVNILEGTGDISGVLFIIKLKSGIHEQCRLARLSLMKKINEGDNPEEYETLFLYLRQDKVDAFMNDRSIIQPQSNVTPNKRKKI
ncbi:unnamed protein product [Rotaria magnacalcarata]|uniref:Uncharacterized protein n=1 Tax=Rotaria magnacalcarata TaxID=392030 RepID=A0A819UC44_9BILA|nr:unnamed protein product [Rotaria magnacalcarata]CAF4179153.1 unnamed protein product [Rotaria magnacalcarata]